MNSVTIYSYMLPIYYTLEKVFIGSHALSFCIRLVIKKPTVNARWQFSRNRPSVFLGRLTGLHGACDYIYTPGRLPCNHVHAKRCTHTHVIATIDEESVNFIINDNRITIIAEIIIIIVRLMIFSYTCINY